MFPQEIFYKLDALRLFLKTFRDGSRAIVATWLVEYCIQFVGWPCMPVLCQLTSISMREGTMVGRTAETLSEKWTGEQRHIS